MTEITRLYGKFRATVQNNIDPMQMGRIQVSVPDVSGAAPSTWALPAVPIAGDQMGVFVVPQVGAAVWLEFEQGDPDYPIWSGGWWGQASELPQSALQGIPGNPNIVLQSRDANAIVISDVPGPGGGIMLRSASGSASIVVNDTGIYIKNGSGASITLTGSTVSINDGA